MRVVFIGMDAPAVVAARILAARGVGTFVLADAAPRREAAVALLRSLPSSPHVEEVRQALDRTVVAALAKDADLLVACAGHRFPAVHHWVNESHVPALHAAFRGQRALLGPLVLPGAGPCFLCWRMRALACEDDFARAMAQEEAGDRDRAFHEAPPVPSDLAARAGAVLAYEVLAATLGPGRPRLAGHVLELDGPHLSETSHPLLPRPDCPACERKAGQSPACERKAGQSPACERKAARGDLPAPSGPDQPRRGETAAPQERGRSRSVHEPADGQPAEVARRVVSPLCGLVRRVEEVRKDRAEPEKPFIVRAELANARFTTGEQAFVRCSGKGGTREEARDGAIGEALERYAALTWRPDRQVTARRADLDGPSLDPRDLVLYAAHQYSDHQHSDHQYRDHHDAGRRSPGLPYVRYTDDRALTWTPARSLATGGEVWVPLVAVSLAPELIRPEEYLFAPTSNGLAAGSSTKDAVRRALLEVVERDAFLIAWAHRLPGRAHDALDVPDPGTREIAAAYARRGVAITVHRLPTDAAAAVVLAIGWGDGPPAAVAGLGADPDPRLAARRAVLEVAQVRPALLARLRVPATAARMEALAADPLLVAGLGDHDLLYAHPEAAARGLRHLRSTPLTPWDAEPLTAPLVRSLIEAAGDVLYADVTPADVAALGVRVVRAIVPGFQPISFGAADVRLGDQLGRRRLYELPRRLGLRTDPARQAAPHEDTGTLNLDPHPLS